MESESLCFLLRCDIHSYPQLFHSCISGSSEILLGPDPQSILKNFLLNNIRLQATSSAVFVDKNSRASKISPAPALVFLYEPKTIRARSLTN
jgi:hypothetical protein